MYALICVEPNSAAFMCPSAGLRCWRMRRFVWYRSRRRSGCSRHCRQRLQIELRVDAGRLQGLMPEHIRDLFERCSLGNHLRRDGVPESMRADARPRCETDTHQCAFGHCAHGRGSSQRTVRRPVVQKDDGLSVRGALITYSARASPASCESGSTRSVRFFPRRTKSHSPRQSISSIRS